MPSSRSRPVVIHGRATWAELLRQHSRARIRRAVSGGEIVRVARGVYTLPVEPVWRAAFQARGALCLQSAAQTWGLATLRDCPEIRVAVRRGATPPAEPGVRYRWCSLSDAEIAQGRTSVLRTVLDCAAWLPFDEALAIADGALREGLERAELVAAAERWRGPRRLRRLRVLKLADGRAANPFESALRAVLIEAGITGFVPQLVVRAPGYRARVDLGDRARKIALEAEGYAFHATTRRSFNKDCRRYDELVRDGWLVLRFTWEQVRFTPDWVATMIRDVQATRPPPATGTT